MHNLVVLSTFILCICHHHSSPDLFSSCKIITPNSVLPKPLETIILFSVSVNLTALGPSYMKLYSICLFVAYFLKVHPCWNVGHNAFLRLNNMLLYVYAIFCLFVHLSMDTWFTFTFWLLSVML